MWFSRGSIVFTKTSAFGFLVDNESYMNDEKIMVLLYFSPLIWCLLLFINPNEMFFIIFPLVNIFGGMGDIYFYIKLKSLSPQKRIEWANNFDKKIYKFSGVEAKEKLTYTEVLGILCPYHPRNYAAIWGEHRYVFYI